MNELLKNIRELDYKDRLNLLNNKKELIKIFLLNSKTNPFYFKNILNLYEVKDIIKYFNKEIITKIKEMYPEQEFIYLETMLLKDKETFELALKNNDDLLELLLEKGKNIYLNLNFSYNIILYLIEYIDNKKLDYSKTCIVDIIRYSLRSDELQVKFLNEANIDINYKKEMFFGFNSQIVSNYINNNLVFLKLEDINKLLKYSSVEINPNLYENGEFMINYLLGATPYETRRNIDYLDLRVDANYFYDLLNNLEDKIIKLYNSDLDIIEYSNNNLINNLLNKYFNKKNIDKKIITKKILFQIVIDKFFQDCIRNVCLNIKEIIDFNNNIKLLTNEKLLFYQEILSLFDKDNKEIIKFYNKYKDNILVSDFYDDINICKQESYNQLKKSCLKIENINNLKDKNLSNKYNLDIYRLEGIKFKMLVTCRSTIPKGNARGARNCYSLISDNNLQVFSDKNYIYGFNNFDIKKIMHIYEADSYSDNVLKNTTKLVNRIRMPDEILSTNLMNEIQILNEKIGYNTYERLLPNYVICFNELNDKSIEAAKLLNIPIIIINKSKYEKDKKIKILDNFGSTYMTSIHDEVIYQNKKL